MSVRLLNILFSIMPYG